MSDLEARSRQRERLLFRYTGALERGDLETVAAILRDAERDPVLMRQITEINEALNAEDQGGLSRPRANLASANGRKAQKSDQEWNTMHITREWTAGSNRAASGSRKAVSFTAAAALVAVLLLGALTLILMNGSGPSLPSLPGAALQATETANLQATVDSMLTQMAVTSTPLPVLPGTATLVPSATITSSPVGSGPFGSLTYTRDGTTITIYLPPSPSREAAIELILAAVRMALDESPLTPVQVQIALPDGSTQTIQIAAYTVNTPVVPDPNAPTALPPEPVMVTSTAVVTETATPIR